MTDITLAELVGKRKKEFESFLTAILTTDNQDLVTDAKSMTDEEFMIFITRAVLPYKNCLDLVITVIFLQIQLKREDVSDENINKFKKYLEFFCEAALEINNN